MGRGFQGRYIFLLLVKHTFPGGRTASTCPGGRGEIPDGTKRTMRLSLLRLYLSFPSLLGFICLKIELLRIATTHHNLNNL
ncbi:hypothetical protein F4809DRAFT_595339 [Biscogniauxia mediterranea]|nr:hypothetical protein F4809DRAFT_595339 [Biscogniauxia mediterranea]